MTGRIQRRDEQASGGDVVVVARGPGDEPRAHPPLVTHAFASLSFFTGGESRFEQLGQWRLKEGDVLLVPAGHPHRVLASRGAESWGVGFCVPCFAAEESGRLLEPFERVRAGGSAVVTIPKPRRPFLLTLIRELQAASAPGGGEGRRAVQRSLLTLILDEVERAARGDGDAPRAAGVVAESLRFIERNCLKKLTVTDVARAVGKTPAYVTTAISKATGRSAVEWITAGRMAEARRLLLHSDERVDIVAERVGYADPTHFIRMFRRTHGQTPAAWRAARSVTEARPPPPAPRRARG